MKKTFGLALSLILTSSLVACGPQAQSPTTPSTPAQNSSGSSVNVGGTVQTGGSSSNPQTTASSQASAELQAALIAEHESEATYSDTQTVAQGSGGFATQAIGIEGRGEVSATALLPRVGAVRSALRPLVRRAATRAAIDTRKDALKRQTARVKATLEKSDAITISADGMVTIDAPKLKAEVKSQAEARKATMETRIASLRAKLQDRKELAQDKMQQLRRKNNVVRSSDTVETTNADGSITKTISVEFKNDRAGMTRESTLSRTTLDGKLVSSDYSLKMTTKHFTREETRSTTINADGSRTVNIYAMTTWNDGRKRERHEERVVTADGNATGTGTLTLTLKDGTTKTFNIGVNVTATGEVDTVATDPTGTTEVVVDESASGEAVVTTSEAGTVAEVTVNVEAEVEAQAEDSSTLPAEASAEASAEAA
jgi:hypothetical protein